MMGWVVRFCCLGMVVFLMAFLLNNVLTFWFGWPGAIAYLTGSGGDSGQGLRGLLQVAGYLIGLALVGVWVLKSAAGGMRADARRLNQLAAYIVRGAFWAVLLVGVADGVVTFLRVEDLLSAVAGEQLSKSLGRPSYRGEYLHLPLILAAYGVAAVYRKLDFSWLAVLVVFAEFMIVISRFVFSYEQAFMADLVRFWYAALFLFASAYALMHEGHVRVDVLYARFGRRARAWVNALGALLLGLPVCWTILWYGTDGKGATINAPLLSYEITQTGFGMYVKYLMAGFLLIFAVSMAAQFCAYILHAAADLADEPGAVFESGDAGRAAGDALEA